ncbi:MAG: XRE family transcriptional regulator [Methylobacter sp.]
MSQSELARAVGVKPQAIQYLCEQGKRSVHSVRIAEVLKINAKWLTTGIGDIDEITNIVEKNNIDESSGLYSTDFVPYRTIPVIGNAQFEENGIWSIVDVFNTPNDGYVEYPSTDPTAYALRCLGESMWPRIHNGEFIIIEPSREAIPGDEILIKALDGRIKIKTLLYTRNGRIHIQSINEARPPISILLSEITAIHPVTAIVKPHLWTKKPHRK